MSITTIEPLSKIHRYYITNIKDELRYYQPNISENNIVNYDNNHDRGSEFISNMSNLYV